MSWGISRSKIKRLYMYFMSCWFWWLMVLIFMRFLPPAIWEVESLESCLSVKQKTWRGRMVNSELKPRKNGWLEDDPFLLGRLIFRGLCQNFGGVLNSNGSLQQQSLPNVGRDGTEETADQPKLWVANFFRVDKSFEWHVWLQAMMKSSWTFKSCLQILWVLIDEAWLVFWKNHQSNFKKERHSSHFIPKMWFMVNMPWCPARWSSPSPVWDYQLTSDSVKRMPVLKRTQISQLGWEICIDISRYLR